MVEIIDEQGNGPQYIPSDNGHNLCKAASQMQLAHHCDISHKFAVFLKLLYEKDEEFVAFRKAVGNTKHLALSKQGISYAAKAEVHGHIHEYVPRH